jgi:site-specific DNA-methyltransferase (adenine-specific)
MSLPAPFYEDEACVLYHGDCLDVLPQLAPVDHVITDPPYSGRTHAMAKTNKGAGHGVIAITFASLSDEQLRQSLEVCGTVSRRWVIASLDYAHAATFDVDPPTGLRSLRIGIWVKPNPMPQISADRPAQGWEAISFFHRADTKPRWNGGGQAGVWSYPVSQNTGHPTSKPLPLLIDLVALFTDEGETILDPFAGSGTTLVAAKLNGRKAIGIELSEQYCAVAAKRLRETEPGRLFDGFKAKQQTMLGKP